MYRLGFFQMQSQKHSMISLIASCGKRKTAIFSKMGFQLGSERSFYMKIKYICESDCSLTNGKIYDVLAIENGWYRIIDDTENDYLFSPEEFEIVQD